MKPRPRRWAWAALGKVALLASLAGCSAIEINVDVYKGSLTNDEHTQLRQYAALAMAAHPVLTLLRNDLEWGRDTTPPQGVLRDDFEPRHAFEKDSARYVNNMLSFYENRRSDAASLALLALRRAQDRAAAFGTPVPEDMAPLMRSLDSRVLGTVPGTAQAAQIRFVCAWRRILSNGGGSAPADLLCRPHLDKLFEAAPDINTDQRSVGLLFEPCRALQPTGVACPADRRSHTGFTLLAEPAAVRSHAVALFGKPEPAFEAYVLRFAHGYVDSRLAMRGLWEHTLSLLEASAQKPAQLPTAARLVAQMTQTRLLACLMTAPVERDAASQQMIHDALGPALAEGPAVQGERWDDARRGQSRSALQAAALKQPLHTVAVLRLLDAQGRQRPARELQRCAALPHPADQAETVPLSARVHGLAAGPRPGPRHAEELAAMASALTVLAPEKNFAWDRGRGDLGLFALYEQLLAAMGQHQNDFRDEEVRRNAAALTEALVPFAERLLFVVNNSSLFQQQDGDDYRTERSILQTLGNTLLLHANDLRRRRVHEEGQRAGFASELTAAQQATLRGPSEVVEDLRRHLDSEIRKLERIKSEAEVALQAATERVNAATQQRPELLKALELAKAAVQALPAPPAGLVAAHHTLLPALPPVLAGVAAQAPSEVERATARADTEALRKHLRQALGTAAVKPKAVQGAAVKWLQAQAGSKTPTLPRQLRLAGAALYLGGLPAESEADVSVDEWLQAVMQRTEAAGHELRGIWREPLQQLAAAQAAMDQADRAFKLAEDARKVNHGRHDEVVETYKKQQDATARALSVLAAALDQALKDGIDNPEGMRALVLKAVMALPAGSNGDSIALAARLVRSANLPTRFPFDRDDYARGAGNPDKPAATRIQVVDDVITLLRNRRIKALSTGDGTQAAHLQKAIDAAHEHRTSLIFLRPAADYLRNVYAATALQDEARDPNRNMLLDYLRTLSPKSKRVRQGGWAGDNASTEGGAPGEAPRAGTRVEIDVAESKKELEKLFWQNINRVTLSGGGDANYAIAKDDVGNWYVKSYSSDPRQIFQSARNLLLFNQGGRLDSNLLRRADLRQQAELETDDARRSQALAELNRMDAQSSAGVSFAEAAQRRALARYLQETKADIAALRAANDSLVPLLKARWQERLRALQVADADAAELLEVLVPAAQRRQEAGTSQAFKDIDEQAVQALSQLSDAAQLGGRVVTVLHALRLAGTGIEQMLEEQARLNTPAALKPALKAATREVVGEQLRLAGERRQRSVAAYRDSLATLADAVAAP